MAKFEVILFNNSTTYITSLQLCSPCSNVWDPQFPTFPLAAFPLYLRTKGPKGMYVSVCVCGGGGGDGPDPLIIHHSITPFPCSGIRAHRHRSHQLTKPGFWSLQKWGEWGEVGEKWGAMGENGGKWGEMGGKWGNRGHSTQDVGCGGLWRDVVEENGRKLEQK